MSLSIVPEMLRGQRELTKLKTDPSVKTARSGSQFFLAQARVTLPTAIHLLIGVGSLRVQLAMQSPVPPYLVIRSVPATGKRLAVWGKLKFSGTSLTEAVVPFERQFPAIECPIYFSSATSRIVNRPRNRGALLSKSDLAIVGVPLSVNFNHRRALNWYLFSSSLSLSWLGGITVRGIARRIFFPALFGASDKQ